jgi:hypothetical protein
MQWASFGPPELVNWPAVGLLKTLDDVNYYISLLPMTNQVLFGYLLAQQGIFNPPPPPKKKKNRLCSEEG